MGARDPDTICSPPSPLTALTVGEMRTARWTVTADCQRCRTRVHVDLGALVEALGAEYVLWGRHPRCKVWVRWNVDRRCDGRVTFFAQSSLTGTPVPLRVSGMVRDAAALRSQAAAYLR